ncbi:MAG: hypothetical protein F6J97_19465 [Leptolyngbya sp. SIO4C1]|nr:hypothetical protein [Leptolyngbya sp. SIO4C1]
MHDGLRDLSQPDSFEKAGFAIEAQTAAANGALRVSVTYGEALYDSRLDTSPALETIKREIQAQLQQSQTAQAIVHGLEATYALNHPPATAPPAGATGSDPSSQPAQPADSSGSNNDFSGATGDFNGAGSKLDAKLAAGIGTGILGGSGLALLIWRRRRYQQLERHQIVLKARITTLLMACHDLLSGDSPADTILYSLFSAAGGQQYAELDQAVQTGLLQARQALNQAFITQDQLAQRSPKWPWDLNRQVKSWETLYLTLIGQQLHRENLTDSELRVVLDPLQTLDAYRWENRLAAPLKQLQQKLAETPLAIELKLTPLTADTDSLGILGMVQQIKAQIVRLRESEVTAPKRLVALQQYCQKIAAVLPNDLGLSVDDLLAGVRQLLDHAAAAMAQTRFLETLADCEQAAAALSGVIDYRDAIAAYRQHQTEIQTLLAAGFRPPQYATQQAALEDCLAIGRRAIAAGDYATIPDHLAVLSQLDRSLLQHVRQWQQRYDRNCQQLEHLQDRLSQLSSLLDSVTTADWPELQRYPADNWQSVVDSLPTAERILRAADRSELPQIAALNSLQQQRLDVAQQQLQSVCQQIDRAEGQILQVRQQLEMVQTLAIALADWITQSGDRLRQIDAFCSNKFFGLFGHSEPQLQTAAAALDQAQQQVLLQQYMSGLARHDEAGHLMPKVYLGKLVEMAQATERRVNDWDAGSAGRSDYRREIAQMPSTRTIETASGDGIHYLYQQLNEAKALLKSARRSAEAAIRRAQQRRREAERRHAASRSSYTSSASSRSSHASGSSRRSSRSASHGSSSRRSSTGSSKGSSRRR